MKVQGQSAFMTPMQMLCSTLRYITFPIVLPCSTYLAWLSAREGASELAIVAVSFVSYAALLQWLEIVIPYSVDWRHARGDTGVDLTHFGVNQFVGPLFEWTTYAAAAALQAMLPYRLDVWPSSWHLIAQIVLAVVLADLLPYWYHRCCHEHSALLWRLHSVHHSPERMYWFNTNRMHPLDHFMNILLRLGSKVLLGMSHEVLFLATYLYSFHGMFTHANVDVRLGPLNRFFSMTELHRWHHSKDRDEAKNYGGCTILWDLVFRTRFLPAKGTRCRIGLEVEVYPRTYLGQLLYPFRRFAAGRTRDHAQS